MQSNTARILVGVGSVVAVVVLLIVFAGGDGEGDGGGVATTTEAVTGEGASGEITAGEDDGSGQGSGTDGGGSSRPEIETIVVRGGEPTGGVTELDFSKGEVVRFAVRCDVPEEVHVHGYDVYKDLEPGKKATLSFPANIDGVFEVELHGTGAQIAQLTVQP